MKKILAMSLLAVLVLAGCGYTTPKLNSEGEEVDETEVDTSDWKTYEAEEFGVKLSFKYPPGVEVSEQVEDYGEFRSFPLLGGNIIIRAWTDPVAVSRGNVNDYAIGCNVDESNTEGSWPRMAIPKEKDSEVLEKYMGKRQSLLICYSGKDLVAVDSESRIVRDDLKYSISISAGNMSASEMAHFLDEAYAFLNTFEVQELE